MKSFQKIENEVYSLRANVKKEGDPKERTLSLGQGIRSLGLPSIGKLEKEFLDRLRKAISLDDWQSIWQKKAQRVAELLGDCYGIKGGAHRRLGEFKLAIEAYDNGFIFEKEKEFNIANSYNRVQRLVVRILNAEQSIATIDDLDRIVVPHQYGILEKFRQPSHPSNRLQSKTLLEELRDADVEIYDMLYKTESAKGDIWREADLVLIRLLLGEENPLGKLWKEVPLRKNSNEVFPLKMIGSLDVLKSINKVIDDLRNKFERAGDPCIKLQLEQFSLLLQDLIGVLEMHDRESERDLDDVLNEVLKKYGVVR